MEGIRGLASTHRPAARGLFALGIAAASLSGALALACTYAPPARAWTGLADPHGITPRAGPGVAPSPATPGDADSPAMVLDQPARAWTFTRWVDTKPMTLEGLRGRVVLVR